MCQFVRKAKLGVALLGYKKYEVFLLNDRECHTSFMCEISEIIINGRNAIAALIFYKILTLCGGSIGRSGRKYYRILN